jgi:5-methylcytosine-specific restriction endonuclease McrA
MTITIIFTIIGFYILIGILADFFTNQVDLSKEDHRTMNKILKAHKTFKRKNRYKRYKARLADPSWRKLKSQNIRDRGYVCESCSSEHRIELHHITYENLGSEKLEDMALLCRNCHQEAHDKYKSSGRKDERYELPSFYAILEQNLNEKKAKMGKKSSIAAQLKENVFWDIKTEQ